MTEHKMTVVCTCGTKLAVQMAHYLKMRCPRCHVMLGEEIERQAARNSKTVWDIAAIMTHERLTSKKWSMVDEKIVRILARHEIESHGGMWPPPQVAKDEGPEIILDHPQPSVVSPLHKVNGDTDTSMSGPAFASAQPIQPTTRKSIKVKVKKGKLKMKKGRR